MLTLCRPLCGVRSLGIGAVARRASLLPGSVKLSPPSLLAVRGRLPSCPMAPKTRSFQSDWRSWQRSTYEEPRKISLTTTLLAINVGVFGVWFLAESNPKKYIGLSRFLHKHFKTSWLDIKQGRLHTLLTSTFSHIDAMHLLMNMVGLYVFGRPIEALMGGRRMLVFYLGAGVLGNLCQAAFFADRRLPGASMVGASGGVLAMLFAYATVYPSNSFLLWFVLPAPAWLIASGLVAYETYQLVNWNHSDRTGHAAHLAGAAAGVAVGMALRRGRFRW
eukprot:GILJ01006555.1.p1 GENE.GILJ01006555.1~~GILJ01006555.1.p1  ORF type:complete len:276 (+),score=5.36 GILJ01006555.1:112-939(+)